MTLTAWQWIVWLRGRAAEQLPHPEWMPCLYTLLSCAASGCVLHGHGATKSAPDALAGADTSPAPGGPVCAARCCI